MTTLIVISVIVFALYCLITDWNGCSAKHSPTIVTILCRLVARHIKLAFKLLTGLLYFLAAISVTLSMQKNPHQVDAPQGHFANFMDRVTMPIQFIVDGILGILGVAAMGALLGFLYVVKSILLHPIPYTLAAIILYLLWLVTTVCELVRDEVASDFVYVEGRRYLKQVITDEDYFMWSAGVFILWIALMTASVWLSCAA